MYTLAKIAEVVGGGLFGHGSLPIGHLSIDSRRSSLPPDTLFFALKGERHDGHRYLKDVAARGGKAFVVSDAGVVPAGEGLSYVVVKDPLDALQRLAGWHRAHFKMPVIGITGSNGKTVVKEWLYQMLSARTRVVRSPGSWNSQVGVPLSVWELRQEHEAGIFEAGISRPGEMERARAVIRPTLGIFTNIGPAHGENFRNDLEKALEKVKLFQGAEALVYCADHHPVAEALRATGMEQRMALRGWSRERHGWLHVVREEVLHKATRISVLRGEDELTFEIPFTDKASIENALHCVTLLLHMGYVRQWIAGCTPHLAPVAMRLEVVDGVHGMKLINDAYSNDLASLGIALDHLGVVGAGTRKAVLLTEMLDTGMTPATLSGRIGQLLERAGVDLVITVGKGLVLEPGNSMPETIAYPDTATLLGQFDPERLAGHTVLVKGARTFALEQVVQRWERRVHGTVLEIDLDAVRHNLNHYRALLRPGVRIMAMVKAFGYGSGAVELARLFTHERLHYLGVAYADEGVELRRHGITLPILVMNPEPVPYQVLADNRLEAVVYDMRSLKEAIAFGREDGRQLPLHLKLDTGMHRLGSTAQDLPELLLALQGPQVPVIASIFSHLVASEAPAHDDFTRQQIGNFLEMSGAIAEVLGYMPLRHIANTAAISRHPDAQLDMVRLGIGMHGIGADKVETAKLQHTLTLRTPVAQIKPIRKGESIGYGRSFIAEQDMRTATLPIGYADGFSRRLSNGRGRVWIGGAACPVVGNVCMDMVMVDVTDVEVHVGDEAVIFDQEHPITELAAMLDTIPYEVLTSISQRVKRVHVHE